MKDKNIIFLDIDGVLNCQLFYAERQEKLNQNVHDKLSRKDQDEIKAHEEIDWAEHYKSEIDPVRVSWLNDLCKETSSVVVIASTWRSGKTVEELQTILNNSGATFEIIGKTRHCDCGVRGVEIKAWLEKNITPDKHGCHYFDFYKYAIIDDDSDMLLTQEEHFFQTDTYSGLTPSTCYRIKRFLTKKTF